MAATESVNLTNIQNRLGELAGRAERARAVIENVSNITPLVGTLVNITRALRAKVDVVNSVANTLQIPEVTGNIEEIRGLANTMENNLRQLAALIPEDFSSQSGPNTQEQGQPGQPGEPGPGQAGGFFGPFKGLFGGDDKEKVGQYVAPVQPTLQNSVVTESPTTGGFVWNKSKSHSKTRSSKTRSSKTSKKTKRNKKSRKHKRKH